MIALALGMSSCEDVLLVDYSITEKYVFENKSKQDITASFDISVPEKWLGLHESTENIEKTITMDILAKGEYEGSCPVGFAGNFEVKDIEAMTDLNLPLFECCKSVTFTWPDGASVTHRNPAFYPDDTGDNSIFLSQNYEKKMYYERSGFAVADTGYPIYTFKITK